MENQKEKLKKDKFSLTKWQLESILKGYNSNHSLELIVHNARFKYLPRNLSNELYHLFLKAVIKHTLGFRLSQAIKDYTVEWQVHNNLEIKKCYMNIYYSGFCKSDNEFETVMAFLRNRFTYIFFSRKFEHEVFISVVSTILGVKVGGGTYESLIEKHTDVEGSRTKFNSTGNQILKNLLKQNLPKIRTKASRILRRMESRPLLSEESSEESEDNTNLNIRLRSFHKCLKENLHVRKPSESLKKKPKIKEFYEQYPLANEFLHYSEMQHYDRNMKNLTIKAHQISESMKADIGKDPKNNILKPVYIQCQPIVSSSFYEVTKIRSFHAKSLHRWQAHNKQEHSLTISTKKDIQQWQNIIEQMKATTSKHHKETINDKIVKISSNKYEENLKKIKNQGFYRLKKQQNIIENEMEFSMKQEDNQTNYKSKMQLPENEICHKIPSLNILKKQKQKFIVECGLRNEKTHQSMFNYNQIQ